MPTMMDYVCFGCGKEFSRRKSAFHSEGKTIHHFCSESCRRSHPVTKTGVTMVKLVCHSCGKEYERSKAQAIRNGRRALFFYCSMACRSAKQWNDGQRSKFTGKNGYVMVHLPDHPNASKHGWIQEQVLIMTINLGRPLIKGEVVHHLNGEQGDNRPQNLVVMKRSEHARIHALNMHVLRKQKVSADYERIESQIR